VLLLSVSLAAQQRTGNIYGQVVDQEGTPLPGVTLTLTHRTIAPLTTVTSEEGRFRFLSLFPAKDYKIRAELMGFKPRTEEGVIVVVGGITEIKVTMETGVIQEEVTVIAVSPVVESKKTTVTQTVNYETLQSLPTARDPWVILQMTPSIQVDRENVGGNESGQQSSYVAKGGDQFQQQWVLDGVLITDPAARGGSPTYFDFDVFEEMQVTVGGMDVETQLGGVALNLVTRRGGNRLSLGARFFLTDQKFQAAITPEKIAKLGVPGYNQIIENKDYGFNVGGPIWKDKAWWWGSYGVQEVKETVIAGSRDDTYLNNLAAKINLQLLPQNRFEFFIHAGKKEKFGRSSNTQFPPGFFQHGKYHFGSPILKLQDEHTFGDKFFVSLKYGFTDAGFGLSPMNDIDLKNMQWYNVEADLIERSNTWFFSGRPNHFLSGQATYFNDNLLGASHEIKFGVEYTNRYIDYIYGYPGNAHINYNYNEQTVDWDGDGDRDIVKDEFGIDLRRFFVLRGGYGKYGTRTIAGYLKDTISFGRFNLQLGLRFDRQHPWIGAVNVESVYTKDTNDAYVNNYYEIWQKYTTPGTAEKIATLLPGLGVPDVDPDFNWDFLSPRIGLTWDIFGDGKTIAKLAGATYGEYMGIIGGFWAYGGLGGNMNFWWYDVNSDGIVDWRELYWANQDTGIIYRAWDDAGNFRGNWESEAGDMWSGYNYKNPQELQPSYWTVDPKWKSNRTWEFLFTLEKEIMTDFGVALDLTYRKYDRLHRNSNAAINTASWYYPELGRPLNKDDWMVAGYIPETFVDPKTGETYNTGEAAGRPWYVLKPEFGYTDYRYCGNWPNDRNNVYYGLDLRFNKRLSHKWMLNGSFTLQWQAANYGNNGTTDQNDPTNNWALDGKTYAYSIGGASGKVAQPVFSTWLVKLQGMYQLPWDLDVSFTFNARQGFIIPAQMTLSDSTLPNPVSRSNTIYLRTFGSGVRLPNFWDLNLRLEKALKISETGRIYFMADIFNVFNLDTMNRRRPIFYGTYYVNTGRFSKSARSFEANEVLNPRVFRLGVRFQFN